MTQVLTTKKSHSKRQEFNQETIKQIKILSKKFALEILNELGFDNVYKWGTKCACPVHGGDNPSAFSYDANKHIWSCFSHHCEQENGNDIIGLVQSLKDFSFYETLEWLSELLEGKSVNWEKESQEWSDKNKHINLAKKNKEIPESKLSNLVLDYSSLKDRNFSQETLRIFQGGLCINTKEPWHNRFMIPIRNIKGKLVGFTGRTIYPRCEKCNLYHEKECPKYRGRLYSKWCNYPGSFQKSLELYNINKAKEFIYDSNEVLVVEGPFDCWNLYQNGFKNVVATLGCTLSATQMQLLRNAGCIKIKLVYDGDSAGSKASDNIIQQNNKKNWFKIEKIALPNGKDPGKLSKEECERFFK